MKDKYDIVVGVDTGKDTGFAVWNKPLKKLSMVDTMQIFRAMEWIIQLNHLHDGRIFVRVEDARKATFGRQNDIHKAQGAGSVKRDAAIFEEFLTAKRIPFEMVRPKKATTKLDAVFFNKLTGWKGKTNSHGRDAAMLVFGM